MQPLQWPHGGSVSSQNLGQAASELKQTNKKKQHKKPSNNFNESSIWRPCAQIPWNFKTELVYIVETHQPAAWETDFALSS